jgi:hypothetical protein
MPEENSGDADRSAVAASHARLSGLRLIADAGGIADRKIESLPAVQMKVAATQAKSRPAFKRQKRTVDAQNSRDSLLPRYASV